MFGEVCPVAAAGGSLLRSGNLSSSSGLMEPSAKILRLVVASTGVQAEKEIVRGVVDELNRGIAKEQNLGVEVARWRKDAYAETGEPQSLVDSTPADRCRADRLIRASKYARYQSHLLPNTRCLGETR